MKKKILIIGYGSIGKRHANLLKDFKNISEIYLLTSQSCKNFKKINHISEVKKINPDYILICSRTSEHYKHLYYIEKNLKKKIILVEKPLFNNFRSFKIKRNKVFVGYNLRYHPIINFTKRYIKNKKIFSINASCSSYLPHWRKNINYSESNSAKKRFGGGALLELSHEIDYVQWIYKKIKKIDYAKIKKISNLKSNTEDCVTIIGKIGLANLIIELNYFSLHEQRLIIINGENFCLKADLIENSVTVFKKKKKKIIKFKVDKNYTYIQQHKLLLSKNYKDSCSYFQGLNLMSLIQKIRNKKK